ncbi:dihydrofolate reductase family protein [Micromonospora polyrhachis]|uniref:Dihydrofolate reductase n=1 Tax=Micromonospora polyrhachis TaxID=1282883 RepID=A0A7W7SQB8_9ACTN|nr:dihydrofolate reductase family protein [Micromonospora polyrhachis]MBB4959017.1 dihydrofolate reductase [Micromonospora polyrhachis]
MRKLVYYVGVSIDGRLAGPSGEVDFYPVGEGEAAAAYMAWVNGRYPETVPTQYRPHVGLADAPNKRFDTVLMGLNTYRAVLDQGISNPYAHLRQYVVSRSLDRIEDPTVELVRDPVALIRDLKREDGLDIWLCGGGGLAGSLLPEIDELIIKSYPVIAGAGATLVEGGFRPTAFAPTGHRSFPNGASITWYARRADA